MLKILSRSLRSSRVLHRIESFLVPQPGEGIAEITIKEWLVEAGAKVKEFDKLCEAFSDKSSIDIKSPFEGTLTKILHDNESVVPVGQPLFLIEVDDLKYPSSATTKIRESEVPLNTRKINRKIAPSVRKLAGKHNVDIDSIEFSHGVVSKEDLMRFLSVNEVSNEQKAEFKRKIEVLDNPEHIDPPPSPLVISNSKDQEIPLSPLQKKMLDYTKLSLIVPQLTYCEDVEVTNLSILKNQLKSTIKGVKITYMPFFLKALSLSLLDFPIMNSVLLDSHTEYLQKSAHNISFAMDTPSGLAFPSIKNVQVKSVYQIAIDLNRIQQLGSVGKLLDTDIEGGTITVSNLGSIGGSYASHLVFPPQVLIGAFGAIKPRLQRINGKYENVEILTSSWSADHRLVDGATTARFAARWKALIENPSLMLLHLK